MAVEAFSVVGVDHHRAPLALRERLAIGGGELPEVLEHLLGLDGLDGLVVLSTCNRCEFYCFGAASSDALMELIAQRQGVDVAQLAAVAYCLQGAEALRHLLRVTASLESMVVGEYQILHQVKFAYEQARQQRATTGGLNRWFQRALATGKEVRNATGIGRYKLSVASIAVDLARQIHGDLTKAHLLIAGAGEMADLGLQHFLEHGIRRVTLVNRNRQRAEDLAARLLHAADREVQVVHWHDLQDVLGEHDIVLSSTASPTPVISQSAVRQAMAKRRSPLMIIDLAVPRDVESSARNVDDVYLYDMDHLEAVVASNRLLRSDEIADAEALLERRLTEILADEQADHDAIRRQVAHLFDAVVAEESLRLGRKLGLAEDRHEDLRYGLSRVGNKLQHRVLAWLREHSHDPRAPDQLRDILGLDGTDDP